MSRQDGGEAGHGPIEAFVRRLPDRAARVGESAGAPSARALSITGLIGLSGCIAALAADFAAWIVHPHFSPMGETISDLAAGRYAIIADLGLYAFSTALLAVAWGLWTLSEGREGRGAFWQLGCLALALMAVDVAVMGGYAEYGDGDVGGFEIHKELVFALGGLTLAAPLCLARGLGTFGTAWRNGALAFAGLWVIAAPPFFFVPTRLDGGYERLVALVLIAGVVALSVLLIRLARPTP